MPRYWVIAPFENKKDFFDKVWQFDLTHDVISIGWSELGDISKMGRDQLAAAVQSKYSDLPRTTQSLFTNMLWKFYHEVAPGDFIIARRGVKTLAAVGTVTATAQYNPGKNPAIPHGNFLAVHWLAEPRDKVFPVTVFPLFTLAEIPTKARFEELVDGLSEQSGGPALSDKEYQTALGPNQYVFALEKYLEDFIVSNFDSIFKRKMRIYEDALGNQGQQYETEIGRIDILAVEPDSGCFVVIELKKARTSDEVIGQILRYMGWVKKNLCKERQEVRGIVICRKSDQRLSYAIDMTTGIEVKYYDVDFWLGDAPRGTGNS